MTQRLRTFFYWVLPASLRARLFLLIALSMLPATASIISSALHERSNAIETAQAEALTQTRRIITDHNEAQAAARQLLGSIANLPAIRSGSMDACSEKLAELLQNGGMFANLGLFDAKGILICSATWKPGQAVIDSSDRIYFQRAIKTRGFVAGEYQIGRVTKKGSINYALPLYNDDDLRGVLFANFPIAALLKPHLNTSLPQETIITLLDPGFTVVARSPADDWIGKNIAGTELHRLLAQGATEGIASLGGFDPGLRTHAYTTAKLESGEVQGYVVDSKSDAVILASANQAAARNLAYLALIFMAISIIALVGSEVLILKPVIGLLTATRKLAAGDLGARVPAPKDKSELAVLGDAFNDMADRVESQVGSIESLNRTYAMLTAINSAIFLIRDRDKLINETCRIAVEVGGYSATCIYLVDTKSPVARLAAHAGTGKAVFENNVIPMDGGASQRLGPLTRALSTGVHAISRNVALTPGSAWTERWHKIGIQSGAAFPLTISGRVYGALGLFSPTPDAFDDEKEIQLLLQLAADTTLGLEHIEKEAHIARLTRVQAVLTEINSALLRMQKTKDMAHEACRIAVDTGNYLAAVIIMLDKKTAKSHIAGHAGVGGDHFKSFEPDIVKALEPDNTPLVLALRTGTHVVEQEIALSSSPERMARARKYGLGSVAAFPLRIEGQVAGVLVLWSSIPHAFDEDEVLLLQQFAADTGLGLEHIGQQAHVYQLANFDRLTGLPNRNLFEDRATQILSRAPHLERVAAVLVVRVGRFLQIHAQHGRAGVDQVITQVARYLDEMLRPGDTVARLGENDFGVLLADVSSVEDAVATAHRIIAGFPKAIPWESDSVKTDGSMGIAIYPQDGQDIPNLIRNAELALNNITLTRQNTFAFYSADLDLRAHERHLMEIELAGALERHELSLVYQPVVRIADRTIIGAEALLRWNNRTLGQVSPAVFIPLAESTGLIERIGMWVTETAWAQHVAWQKSMHKILRLAVNVSSRQLRSPDFLDQMKQSLEKSGLDPSLSLLGIEITESELMENIDRMIPVLNELKAMGIHLSIDDFGTGYSSLSYIRRLPVDTLKIDIGFVREIATDEDAKTLAASIVALGHSMNLMVVAEGVETETQLQVLASMGCDAAQGYLFSRPVPAEKFEQLVIFQPSVRPSPTMKMVKTEQQGRQEGKNK